jgi:hypothetical protein
MTNMIDGRLQQQALTIMQAMLGVISPNFRMVSISMRGDVVRVQVVLECNSKEDRLELEDCQSEFEALQAHQIDYEFDVIVTDSELTWPNESSIVIYRRREN